MVIISLQITELFSCMPEIMPGLWLLLTSFLPCRVMFFLPGG